MRKIFIIVFCFVCSYVDAQEFVDLGLSVKWGTSNIGAPSFEQSGELFAWGETVSKKSFTMENYKYKDSQNEQWTIDIGKNISGTSYDAATLKNKDWRLPTQKEFLELCEKCEWKWIANDKGRGYNIIGPNGNQIFLPIGGLDSFGQYDEKTGNYWSGTLSQGLGRTAIALSFNENGYQTEGTYKVYGKQIRPVKANPNYDSRQVLPKEWSDLKYANLIQQIESEDYENAFNTATMLAAMGDAQAQCVLATMYMSATGTLRNYESAQELLVQAAKQGYSRGEYILGGFGSLEKSHEFMNMFVSDNEQLSANDNDFWYQMLSTESVPENYKDAFKWFYLKDGQWGYRDIMYYAGIALIRGDYGYKNVESGLQWIVKSARLGYKDAEDLLNQLMNTHTENEE